MATEAQTQCDINAVRKKYVFMDIQGHSKAGFEVSELVPIGFSELWIRLCAMI